jgi:beta-glucanase (GH16 family)
VRQHSLLETDPRPHRATPDTSSGAGRHATPRPRSRRSWRTLAIFYGLPVLILIGGAAVAAPLALSRYEVAGPVTVQALDLDTATPAVGQPVKAAATVVAEQALTFDYVAVAVRDPAGRNVDFPGTPHWQLGTTPKAYTATRTFDRAGTYTYWFAYKMNGRWTDLSPRKTFTVGASSAPTTSGPTTPSTTAPPATSAPAPSATTTSAPPTGSPVPVGVPGSWRYTFGDDFNGPIAWGTTWVDHSSAEADGGHGNAGNQQLEWNQAANCSTADGTLTLTAKPDNITSPSGQHYNWSSCLITSTPSYSFRYGYIEIRAQLPSPKGFWPAFWTWQAPGNNQYTETDVFEFYSDNHSRLYLTQHSGTGGATVYNSPFDPTTGYHVYGVDIRADGTGFYVDGKLVYTAPGTSTGMTDIIVDNFVYSKIPPDAGGVGTMKVDYVRAWQH